jgi:hypothetical protein
VLAGIGLGTSLDRTFTDEKSYSIAHYWEPQRTSLRARSSKIVPISRGRQPGVVPQIKAISHRD